jgi:hypothetical protein
MCQSKSSNLNSIGLINSKKFGSQDYSYMPQATIRSGERYYLVVKRILNKPDALSDRMYLPAFVLFF